jgi:hypothetical protein
MILHVQYKDFKYDFVNHRFSRCTYGKGENDSESTQ